MDNPWGSPWTTTDSPSKNELVPPSPPRALLSPPPRALVGSLAISPVQSPWADDEAFRDWPGASPDPTHNKKHLSDWGVWGDTASLHHPPPTPRHDASGRASPLAWPSSTATSPGLKPLPRSRTSSIFRGNSPDPWAAESSLKRRDTVSSFSLSVHEPPPLRTESSVRSLAPSVRSAIDEDVNGLGIEGINLENTSVPEVDDQEPVPSKAPPTHAPSREPAVANLAPADKPQEVSPRPSSTFSHPVGPELDRQDSPITSIDEEPKPGLQAAPAPRKTNGKVQQLVGIYDDLTKASIKEPPPPIERRETSHPIDDIDALANAQKTTEEDDDGADFGDFEDATQDAGEPVADSISTPAVPDRPSTPPAHPANAVPPTPATNSTTRTSPFTKATAAAVAQLFEKFGPISFDVDSSAVDKLFPAAAPTPEDKTEEPIDAPERLITDTFESLSERKAWYRVSRFGSKRKHDSGDGESYSTIMWPNSVVRGDTLKIVRRWMEEDSYTGRAILGGGKRTSVFNWDSDSAAPVDLNVVFGRKASHSRTNSVQQKGHSSTPSTHSNGPPSATIAASRASTSSLHTNDVPSTPVANFGWNASTADSPKVYTAASTGTPRHSIEPPPSLPTATTLGARKKAAPSPIILPKPEPVAKVEETPPVDNDGEDDDDDDWGEMVSSPVAGAQPSIEQVLSPPVLSPPPPQLHPPLQAPQPHTEDPAVAASANLNAAPPAPAAGDPWSFADFSVFDAAPLKSPAAHSHSQPRTPSQLQLQPSPVISAQLKTASAAEVATGSGPSAAAAGLSSPIQKMEALTLSSLPALPPPAAVPTPTRTPTQPSTAATPAPAPALKSVLQPIEEGTAEQAQELDEIVRAIVHGLPDLSYMLRG